MDLSIVSNEDQILVDTCLQKFYKATDDTSKINAIYQIIDGTWDKNIYPRYSRWLYNYTKPKFKNETSTLLLNYYRRILAEVTFNIGYFYESEHKMHKAIKYYSEAITLYKQLNDKENLTKQYLRLGFIYNIQGDIPLAIETNYKALKIAKELNDEKNLATCYTNIGSNLQTQKDYKSAEEYFNKAAIIYQKLDNISGRATSFNNIGFIHKNNNNYPKALEYFLKSLEICKDSVNDKEKADALHNTAGTYSAMGDLNKALKYYEESINYRKKCNDLRGLALAYGNYAGIYLKLGKVDEANKFSKKGLELSKKINNILAEKSNAIILSQVAEKQGRGKEALEMFKLYITLKDSLNNETTQKSAAKQQAKYEYEKQKAIDDAEYEKQLAIEKEAKAKQKIMTYATAGGLGLVVIFLAFVFNRLQVTKKQKIVIESQKIEVEQQKTVVENAHKELEEKNKEITDSIQYAKRIQNAILPPLKIVKEYLNESFILYKPKDIVAGDFYWLEQKDGNVLFAAADCTGHGVPGAMVSVVCNNGLNRSVREYGLSDPGEILNKTREIIIAEFEKSDDEVKDGMDIALCSLTFKVQSLKLKEQTLNIKPETVAMLQYAGANNPLWIIRDNELIEIKANKQPIGQFDNPEPYKTHKIELQKGDSIYIFSDGYVDQFGGEKGKKIKSQAFRVLLLSIQDKSMEEQKNIINQSFESWKGDLEQIDDVCILGVRI